MECFSDQSDIAESDNVVFETSLSLTDILPINPKNYDKNRAPKVQGQPTIVYFHVTVLSLDSINEESMVNLKINVTLKPDSRRVSCCVASIKSHCDWTFLFCYHVTKLQPSIPVCWYVILPV